jgi:hypothetical protein
MRSARAAVLLWLVAAGNAQAADSTWTVAIVGRRDVVLSMRSNGEAMPSADAHLLAPDLNVAISTRDETVSIRDVNGVEWHTTNGSSRLDGPLESRPLANPVEMIRDSVFLPLDAIAQLAGRKLVLEGHGRAFLLPLPPPGSSRLASSTPTLSSAAPAASGDVRAPLGWETFAVPKTREERDASVREDADTLALQERPAAREIQPAPLEAVGVDLGIGYAQRGGAAIDATGGGTFAGYRVGLAGFLTGGSSGVTVRSGRLAVESPSSHWTAEAGDLLSEMRGLARGVRLSTRLMSRWRPAVSAYVNDGRVAGDRAAVSYRDDVLLTRNVDLRGEVATDGSRFVGVRFIAGRGNIETFYRFAVDRRAAERGVSISYGLGKGVSAHGGFRQSAGPQREQWHMAGLSVPLPRGSSFSVEQARTERQSSSDVANAFGLQLPFGPIRVIQRYTWTDIALVAGPSIFESGRRQLQSMASYSPGSRVRLTYQVGTQWYAGSDVRQWTELESAFRMTRTTSFHAVTGFPEVTDPLRLRVGVQQLLPRAFRLSIDYGHLPAFQMTSTPVPDTARFLVMLRRNWNVRTPAAGADVQGVVRDDSGAPVAGAAVSLGPFLTVTRSDGHYRFAHVPPGEHDVAVAREHLPAAFAVRDEARPLKVRDRESVRLDLTVTALHAIHGRVFLARKAGGQAGTDEGLAGVVVRLDQGDVATLTNADGSFDFYNLQPGPYVVWIDRARLRPDVIAASDERLTVVLEPDRAATSVNFRLAVHEKPVVMKELK